MSRVRELLARVRGSLRAGRSDADLERELRTHIELAAEAHERRSGDPVRAARAAVLQSGTVAGSIESLRDQRGFPRIEELARDLRFALRAIVRTPAFSAVALLTIAIGIGANTAVFAVVDRVLLDPLPYPGADRLVAIWHKAPGAEGLTSASGDLRLSASMYFTYAEQNRTFEHLGIWYPDTATVTGVGDPEQVRTLVVSDGLLQALEVKPLFGRWLEAADQNPGGPETVVLDYAYWQRRFGGDRSAVGRTIDIDARPHEIVGVMPPNFTIADVGADAILAARFDRRRVILPGFGYQGVGRLRAGVSLAQATADIARLIPIWMHSWPAYDGINPDVYLTWHITPALRPLKEDVVGGIGRRLWIVMSMMGLVLLIACANVATLLLIRTEGRQQELAIRAALGSGSGRIVRALVVESTVLSLVGGTLGLGAGWVALRMLAAHGPATLPRVSDIGLDARIVGFAIALSMISGLLFGLIAAAKYASPRLSLQLAGGGRTASDSRERHRMRHGLVVAQIALAIVLLVVSGLMIRTFRAMRAVQPGFADPAGVQTLRTVVPTALMPDGTQVARLERDITDRLSTISGVRSAAFASQVPMDGQPYDWDVIDVEGRSRPSGDVPPVRVFQDVSPGYFATIGTRVVAGRDFSWSDVADRRTYVLVSANLAGEAWGSADAAVGKRIRTLDSAPWFEVIGVVEDVFDSGVDQPAPTIVYWAADGASRYRAGAPNITRAAVFVVRSQRAGTESLAREMQRAVWTTNANLAAASSGTMQQLYDKSMMRTSFTLVTLAIAAMMALTLGVIGIYGVIAYAVSRRTREIGIRLALGAQRGELTRMFVRSGILLTAAGLPIGLAASAAVARFMSSLLFGISPADALTYVSVAAAIGIAATMASYIPARRAAALDPANALKTE